jgi:DNA-binding response OmpR family regulator
MESVAEAQKMSEEIPVILVADDDPDMLALVARHLRTLKCKVLEATDGDMALEVARREKPDLFILDVMMPGKSGWEVCKAVREDEELKEAAVIVLTGIGEHLNAMTSPLYGADASIDKPFEFPELDFKIRKVLSDRRRKKKDAAPARKSTKTKAAKTV